MRSAHSQANQAAGEGGRNPPVPRQTSSPGGADRVRRPVCRWARRRRSIGADRHGSPWADRSVNTHRADRSVNACRHDVIKPLDATFGFFLDRLKIQTSKSSDKL
ncbi:hypothetical protein M5689_010995 [Euphorbia peplus]|nr:hypothetical protein M5689_010995 [Euphorbia peplus]